MNFRLQIEQWMQKHYASTQKVKALEAYAVSSFSETYRFEWDGTSCFLKCQQNAAQPSLFEAEAKGLEILRATKTFEIPEVFLNGNDAKSIFLIMKFVESGVENDKYYEQAAIQLAALHRHTSTAFGLDHNNFIGVLPQSNKKHQNFYDFFIYERLEPLLRLGEKKKYFSCSDTDRFEHIYIKLRQLIPDEAPALLHGDLWHGNIFSNKNQEPVLIDPAVYYGHREAELAFTHLFGNFPAIFYTTYQHHFPLAPGFEERMQIYNLYPLLVHLHLFGKSYLPAIHKILNQYS